MKYNEPKNFEIIRFGSLPEEYAVIVRDAGRNPDDFVYMTEEGDTVVIWEKPEAPTWEDILRQPLADKEVDTFLDFWWDLRDEWQWVWESNFGIRKFKEYLSY